MFTDLKYLMRALCAIVISGLRLFIYFPGMPMEAKNSDSFVHLKIQNRQPEISIFPTPLFLPSSLLSFPLLHLPPLRFFSFRCFLHLSLPHLIMDSTSEKRMSPIFFSTSRANYTHCGVSTTGRENCKSLSTSRNLHIRQFHIPKFVF